MEKLLEIAKYPEPFAEGTHEIWLDRDREDFVLQSHFDENIPGGSKSITFIEETIDFIHQLVPIDHNAKILDMGCGPGLYSQKLAIKGYEVVGVDFNKKAIDYAIEKANQSSLKIEYRNEDMTSIQLEPAFDLTLLIYQIYNMFSLENRKKILNTIYQALKPGGLVLMDVLSEQSYQNFQKNQIWFLSNEHDSLSEKRYLGLYAALKYPNYVTLSRNIMVFDDGEIVSHNYWNQYFNIETLQQEVNAMGFELEKVYADVNGGEYMEDSESFAVVLRKHK